MMKGLLNTREWVATFFLVMVLVFSGVPANAEEAPEFIKVGCTVPLTGKFSGSGVELRDGYIIGIQHINDSGGIFVKQFGKRIPVELTMYDDESNPDKTASRYEMYARGKLSAYFGSFSTILNTSAIAVAEKNAIPIISGCFSNLRPHRQGYQYLFSPFYKTAYEYPQIIDALTEISGDQRPKKIAIVMSRTEYPMETAKAYREKIKQEEGIYEIVVDETYQFNAKDFSMIIAKAKNSGAEVWLSNPTPVEGVAMARQMRELEYHPKFLNMTQATSSRTWPGGKGEIGEYAVALTTWLVGLPWPGNDRLIEDAKKKLGGKLPGICVGIGYMITQVFADAVERAGGLDPHAIMTALTKSDVMTVCGRMKCRENGTFEQIVYLGQWQDGRFVSIWPEKYATAKPVYPRP